MRCCSTNVATSHPLYFEKHGALLCHRASHATHSCTVNFACAKKRPSLQFPTPKHAALADSVNCCWILGLSWHDNKRMRATVMVFSAPTSKMFFLQCCGESTIVIEIVCQPWTGHKSLLAQGPSNLLCIVPMYCCCDGYPWFSAGPSSQQGHETLQAIINNYEQNQILAPSNGTTPPKLVMLNKTMATMPPRPQTWPSFPLPQRSTLQQQWPHIHARRVGHNPPPTIAHDNGTLRWHATSNGTASTPPNWVVTLPRNQSTLQWRPAMPP